VGAEYSSFYEGGFAMGTMGRSFLISTVGKDGSFEPRFVMSNIEKIRIADVLGGKIDVDEQKGTILIPRAVLVSVPETLVPKSIKGEGEEDRIVMFREEKFGIMVFLSEKSLAMTNEAVRFHLQEITVVDVPSKETAEELS